MRKNNTKIPAILLAVALLLCAVCPSAFAAVKTAEVTLRVEGVTECIFYGSQTIEYDTSLTVGQAIKAFDEANDSITMSDFEEGYISTVNGTKAGRFGGWDGWYIALDGTNLASGMDSSFITGSEADIVLYYGDYPCAYPTVDASALSDKGYISFVSHEVEYDADFNATPVVKPIDGATVTLTRGDTVLTCTTDSDGKAAFSPFALSDGDYTLQIERYSANGAPSVARLASDCTVTVSGGFSASVSRLFAFVAAWLASLFGGLLVK